jgi:hypothetical protein
MRRERTAAAAGLVALFLTGCPRVPPAVPRPHAHLRAIDRDGRQLTAHLRVEAGAALAAVAVDWVLAVGERDLVRGRAHAPRFERSPPGSDTRSNRMTRWALDIAIAMPPEVRAGALVRLRGAIHLDGADGPALVPFDEVARVP